MGEKSLEMRFIFLATKQWGGNGSGGITEIKIAKNWNGVNQETRLGGKTGGGRGGILGELSP